MGSRYEVEVTIESAENLKNVNWLNGKLKPYAVVWIDNGPKVASKDPIWNEKLLVPLPPSSRLEDAKLCIDVEHANPKEGEKSLVGSARLPLTEVLNDVGIGGKATKSLELKHPSGRPHGEIKLKVVVKEPSRNQNAPPYGQAASRGYGEQYGKGYGEQYGGQVASRGYGEQYGGYGQPYAPSQLGYGYPAAAPPSGYPYGGPPQPAYGSCSYGAPPAYSAPPAYGSGSYDSYGSGAYGAAPVQQEQKKGKHGMGASLGYDEQYGGYGQPYAPSQPGYGYPAAAPPSGYPYCGPPQPAYGSCSYDAPPAYSAPPAYGSRSYDSYGSGAYGAAPVQQEQKKGKLGMGAGLGYGEQYGGYGQPYAPSQPGYGYPAAAPPSGYPYSGPPQPAYGSGSYGAPPAYSAPPAYGSGSYDSYGSGAYGAAPVQQEQKKGKLGMGAGLAIGVGELALAEGVDYVEDKIEVADKVEDDSADGDDDGSEMDWSGKNSRAPVQHEQKKGKLGMGAGLAIGVGGLALAEGVDYVEDKIEVADKVEDDSADGDDDGSEMDWSGKNSRAPVQQEQKKGKLGMGAGLAIGAVGGVLGGLALAEGVDYVEDRIEDNVADKVEDDLADGDDDGSDMEWSGKNSRVNE